MKPGKRGPNFQEKPDVCHKTPPPNPVSDELKASIAAENSNVSPSITCMKWFIVRKHPQFDYWDWIAQCGCVQVQGYMAITGGFPGFRSFSNRTTLCLPECTKFESKLTMNFGDLKQQIPVVFDAQCLKSGWRAKIKIGGMNLTWDPF